MGRARRGLARTWQLVRLAPGRTVLDNVAAGAVRRRGQSVVATLWRPEIGPARARAAEVIDQLGIGYLAGRLAGTLTLEGQRLTELARALVSEPRLILADELASGLSREQRRALGTVLGEVGSTRTILLVEHDLELLMGVSCYIWALADGRIAYGGDVQGFQYSDVYGALRGLRQADLPDRP